MVKNIFYLIILFISFSTWSLENVSASIDKNPAIEGESIVLEIVADDDVEASALDTSALLDDFVVGRTSTSSNMSSINGVTTRQTRWTTLLVPKRKGKITIPAFTINGKKTAPIALVVVEQSQKPEQRDIYIEAEVSAEEVFVQLHATLTVKLFVGVNLESGSLSEPNMTDTTITKLGDDTQKEEIINGRRFQVVERKFAFSPQKSGEFSLEMPIFSGQVAVAGRNHGFFNLRSSKPVSVITKPINITVKPKPSNYQGHWLPSELIRLDQEWQPAEQEFMVGKPITRTITLTAVGISQEQLPKLEMVATPGLKIYPEQPSSHSGINKNRLVSQTVTNFALVASQAGDYELPEIRIPWFNTITKKQEFAILPAKKITIKANPELAISLPNAAPLSQAESTNQTATVAPSNTIIVQENTWLTWLFLALWLITLSAWFIHLRLIKPNNNVTKRDNSLKGDAFNNLVNACKNHAGHQALARLLPWFNELYPHDKITHIAEGLDKINHQELTNAVQELQASYYGKNNPDNHWQGQALLTAINHVQKQHKQPPVTASFALNP